MDVEHSGLLSWVHERQDAQKTQKPCARWRDADRNRRSASGDPAMVLVFRMASIFRVVTGTVPVTPAAELLLDVVRLSMIFQEKPISTSPQSCPSRRIVVAKIAKSDCQRSCKRRALRGARTRTSSTTNVVLLD